MTEIVQRWLEGEGVSKTNRLTAIALIRASMAGDGEAFATLLPDNAADAAEIIACLAFHAGTYMSYHAPTWQMRLPELLDRHVQVIYESDSPE